MKIIYKDLIGEGKFIVRVALLFGEHHAYRSAYNFVTKLGHTIPPGGELPDECFMDIPSEIWEEMLKGFAELASDKGIKLDSDLKREGLLEATKFHLEDMRSLVFSNKKD
jgi:hypothetical protein